MVGPLLLALSLFGKNTFPLKSINTGHKPETTCLILEVRESADQVVKNAKGGHSLGHSHAPVVFLHDYTHSTKSNFSSLIASGTPLFFSAAVIKTLQNAKKCCSAPQLTVQKRTLKHTLESFWIEVLEKHCF